MENNSPSLRIYRPQGPILSEPFFQPSDWEQFCRAMNLERFNPSQINDEVYRRKYGIALATPFKDYDGNIIYELDSVDLCMGESWFLVVLDEESNLWWLENEDTKERRPAELQPIRQGRRKRNFYDK